MKLEVKRLETSYRSMWRRRVGAVVRWQALGKSSALRLQRVLPHISSSFLSEFDGFFTLVEAGRGSSRDKGN